MSTIFFFCLADLVYAQSELEHGIDLRESHTHETNTESTTLTKSPPSKSKISCLHGLKILASNKTATEVTTWQRAHINSLTHSPKLTFMIRTLTENHCLLMTRYSMQQPRVNSSPHTPRDARSRFCSAFALWESRGGTNIYI
jgi:hypothetical protein